MSGMCPVPSSVTGQPCLLPAGHPQDSETRFHRYARYAPPSQPAPDAGLRDEIEARHKRTKNAYGNGEREWFQCKADRQEWPCDAVRLLALSSPETTPAPDAHTHEFVNVIVDGQVVDNPCACGIRPIDLLDERIIETTPAGVLDEAALPTEAMYGPCSCGQAEVRQSEWFSASGGHHGHYIRMAVALRRVPISDRRNRNRRAAALGRSGSGGGRG